MCVESKIKKIISEVLSISENDIQEDSIIADFPNCDSLKHLKIISMVEKEFSIQFTIDALMDIEDVSDLISVTNKMVAAK